ELAPGAGRVRFRVEVPYSMRVALTSFDVMGRRVCRIADRVVPGGMSTITWDGRDQTGARVESGVYFTRLTSIQGDRVVRVPLVRLSSLGAGIDLVAIFSYGRGGGRRPACP